jgi:hypothetical protein
LRNVRDKVSASTLPSELLGAGYAEHDNIGDYTVEDLNFDAKM